MDFSLTEAQQDVAALTRRILDDHATPERLREVENGPEYGDRTLWTVLAEAGVLGAGLPEAVGGGGYGLLEQCSVLIELGRAVAPVPYLATVTLAASAIAEFGSPEQRAEWAKAAATGRVLTAGLVEELGDDPAAPNTRAERRDGGWRLTGVKTTVPTGAHTELVLVPASTPDGTAVFLVRPDDPGVTVRPQQVVNGDAEAMVTFDGVPLAEDRILGAPDADVLGWLTARGTIGLCALQLGVVERALELTAEYARNRRQFDKPIGAFQAVAQRLADGYVDVEAIRLTLWQAAWRLAEGMSADTEVATAKFWAADGGHRVAHTAVHVHGGVGIDLDHPLHRYFVAAKHHEFALGGATTQLRRIGAALARQ